METVTITLPVKEICHKYIQCCYGDLIVNNYKAPHAVRLVVNADLFGLRTITLLDVNLLGPFEPPLEPGSKSGSKKSTTLKFPGGKASAEFTWSTRSHAWELHHQKICYNMESDKRPTVKKLLASVLEMRQTYYTEMKAPHKAQWKLTSVKESQDAIVEMQTKIEELKANIEATKVATVGLKGHRR